MVFVLSKQKQPMDNCTPAKARILLRDGSATIHKQYPFTIRLKDNAAHTADKTYQIKLDPGAKITGVALVDSEAHAVFFAELEHRGERIVALLQTRYRKPKWGNSFKKKDSKFNADTRRPEGWLPPSVVSIEQDIVHFVKKMRNLCMIQLAAVESVKFDMQKMENASITDVVYQQGTLMGYEIRHYLLEKKGHACQYCGGLSQDKHLEVEHMHPKSRGGSDRLSNLNVACHTCNQDKDNRTLAEYVERLKSSKTKLDQTRIKRIEQILRTNKTFIGLRYAAWANSMRHHLVADLEKLLPHISQGTGGQTQYNRTTGMGLPKEHYYDALCVGRIPSSGYRLVTDKVLCIKSYGRGSRFRGRTNSCGIITKQLTRQKQFFSFQTGDVVRATVPNGKKKGIHLGRVAVRKSGYFNIQSTGLVVQGVSYKHCRIIQRNDGYGYTLKQRS
ncbi:hnh endonuclease [Trichococcus palustris]|jgi:hypothetical protein|uniref:Hnh endonuclease n=1 Tax=Trichococcus palustris TaxID=140314 RepID=A0A143Y5G3_9LACT|nr:RNA-guided endonuclease IscB [Trichococcus palustris]CZQ80638.1 hnh endonuclease [Trichococcus palustris]SFK64166.1 5-methylcytosine-specific restriction endonuclease McrA [Trichococcus palustris]